MSKFLTSKSNVMKIYAAYKCTQQELYAAITLGWQNYQGNLPDFINHKGKYTKAFGDAAITDMNIAKNMPDNQVRNSVPEKTRIELALLAAICVNDWKALKSYIADAFPKELQKVMLEAAGSRYYRRASTEGWAEMQALLICAAQFIDDNTDALSQGGINMPATFPTKFTDDKTAFETKYTEFITASQESTGGTSDKITINNACYDTLMKMLADGQMIFHTN